MKLSFHVNKKNLIWTGAMFALSLIMYLITRYPVVVMFVFDVLFFVLINLKIELSDKVPWIWTILTFALGTVVTVICVQLVILSPEFFKKLDRKEYYYNFLLVAAFYFLVNVFTNRPRITTFISHIFFCFVAYIDYFVYAFRQNEIAYTDITSVGTGLSVAQNYDFELHERGAAIILISILFLTLVAKLDIKFKNKWIHRIICMVLPVFFSCFVYVKTINYDTQTWELKGSYQNGFVLNFLLGIRDSFVQPPLGYSEELVAQLEEQYGTSAPAAENVTTNETIKHPTVIAIMNESFADLSVLGDLQTNEDPMPFVRSMIEGHENTVGGYAVSSIFGAKTPNSEWEYMTGNSMAFLPSGSVVYQQYMSKEPTSIVSNMKNEGYTTVAMHPYYSTGWKRSTIYPKLGFDEQYFMDSDYFDDTQMLRKYITDQELYNKIIERYEQKGADEDLFVMGITMQNHGGYKDYYQGFYNSVVADPGVFNDVNQYLTCLKQSDIAIQNLIQYFENVDEPVEIVFFGDHQPSLQDAFYRSVNGKGMSGLNMDELETFFKVPFFIWTNYDTDSQVIDCTSLNYLSTLTLERANMELPSYNKFLAEMMQTIPAINARGYYSRLQGGFIHLEDATGEEAEWIRNYQALQYNGMFDKKKKSSEFFPYLIETGDNVTAQAELPGLE